jgi:hypothetical protein
MIIRKRKILSTKLQGENKKIKKCFYIYSQLKK